MSEEPKVSFEVAESEFDRFADLMDLDLDMSKMDEDDKKEFEKQRRRVINAIQSGSLAINDKGEPIFSPARSKGVEPLTFHEPTGAALMAMDRKKKTEDIGKLYAAMGEITKSHANVFSKMAMTDLKICMAITTLFLA